MKILKSLLLTLLLALPLSMHAEEGLIVQLKSGSTIGFAFGQKPQIKLGESVQMVTANSTVEYAYADVQKFYFADLATTGIGKVKTTDKGSVLFRVIDDGIVVEGLAKGEHVAAYTLNGTEVAAAKSVGGAVKLNLGARKGVYVVRTSTGVSYKFIKK